MSKYKEALFALAKDRLVYTELEALGVDCANELVAVDKRIEAAKKRLVVAGVVSSYQEKKRWPVSDLSAAQKKKIREMGSVDADVIAEQVAG